MKPGITTATKEVVGRQRVLVVQHLLDHFERLLAAIGIVEVNAIADLEQTELEERADVAVVIHVGRQDSGAWFSRRRPELVPADLVDVRHVEEPMLIDTDRDDGNIEVDGDSLVNDSQKVSLSHTREPAESPFAEHGAE